MNFQAGGKLVGFTSSTDRRLGRPRPQHDNNDDGTPSGTLGTATGFIESGIITLALGGRADHAGTPTATPTGPSTSGWCPAGG